MASLALVVLGGEFALRLLLGRDGIAGLPRAFVDAAGERKSQWRARRAAAGGDPYGFDEPDPELGWRLRPQADVRSVKPGSYDVAVRANDQGLRGAAPVPPEHPPGVLRIAVFGDSQTFGEGVEDDQTFSALLGRGLPGVEVLNFGVHGYGTDQMLLRYEVDGRRFRPDVVVLAFAWFHADRNSTDFSFYAKPRFELDANGELRRANGPIESPERFALAPPAADESPSPLADRSVLARWLWQRVRNLRDRAELRTTGRAWQLTRALVERFAAEVRDDGARFVLVDIDDDQPEASAELRRLAGILGVDFVEIGPLVRAAERGGDTLRLPGDRHWNPAGHALVAAELRRRLCGGAGAEVCGAKAAPAPPALAAPPVQAPDAAR